MAKYGGNRWMNLLPVIKSAYLFRFTFIHFWEKMRTDFNRCNITLVCVVINCLNLTKMFATGKIGLKLFQPVLTWQKRFGTAFTSLKRNAMTIFVFWNWCNIKACSFYNNKITWKYVYHSGKQCKYRTLYYSEEG